MFNINNNILNADSPPIDYFNDLLSKNSNSNYNPISFGHGIPRFTPIDYFDFKNNPIFEPSSYKYSDIRGHEKLRQFISNKLNLKLNVKTDLDNFIITSGANSALFKALFLKLEQGDEVIVPSPVYFNHIMAIQMIGAITVEVDSIEKNGFQLNIPEIINQINDKTKIIILNSPNNPTGAIYDIYDIKHLSEICLKNNITIILDYTYEDYIYGTDYNPLQDFKSLENLIIVGSFSKTFGITGLRIGYICADPYLIDNLCKIQDTISICAPVISQNILLELIQSESKAINKNKLSAEFSRNKLIELIEIIPQLEWITTNGAFYAFIKLPKEINSWEFARDLIVNKSVLVLPGTIFGETWKSHIRIAYGAVNSDEIDEGINRIKNYLEEST